MTLWKSFVCVVTFFSVIVIIVGGFVGLMMWHPVLSVIWIVGVLITLCTFIVYGFSNEWKG